jgi:hypothetical protein
MRYAMVLALALGLLAEYHAPFELSPYSSVAPPLYRYLARQPRGVVAEFPLPRADALPGYDPEYAYMSTFHWFPIVNGYSGMYPRSYLVRLARLANFPDQRSLAQLRADDVRYVILHARGYLPADFEALHSRMATGGTFVELGSYNDADGMAVLFTMR